MTVQASPTQRITTNPDQRAQALADGIAVAHPFGNIYAITSRADAATPRGKICST